MYQLILSFQFVMHQTLGAFVAQDDPLLCYLAQEIHTPPVQIHLKIGALVFSNTGIQLRLLFHN